MKSMALYLMALVGGAAVGAIGIGAYNVYLGEGVAVEATAEGPDGEAGIEGDTLDADPALLAGTDGADPETPGGALDPEAVEGGAEAGAPTDDPDAQVDDPEDDEPETAQPEVVQIPPPDADSLARVQENYQRLARIFAAMKPDEAAPVLAQLDDAQLEGILLAMQGRNAAPILAEMDPERAASLSRRVLRGNR